jgi:hypothetical protein
MKRPDRNPSLLEVSMDNGTPKYRSKYALQGWKLIIAVVFTVLTSLLILVFTVLWLELSGWELLAIILPSLILVIAVILGYKHGKKMHK